MKTESFGNIAGQDWEDLCNKLFHLRYRDNYQEVPARYGGDYGIEGFTFDGDLFQCYSPEDEEFSSKSLYELQRNKITNDIKKLIDNIIDIKKINANSLIKNWHFVTPDFDNKNLVEHCRKKEEEVKQAIPSHTLTDFKIILQTENSYIEEIGHLVNANILQIQSQGSNYTDEDLAIIGESKNVIVEKIRNKLQKLDSLKNDETRLNKFTYLIFKYFLEGQEELDMLNKSYPDVYQKLIRLKNSVEKDIEQKSIIGLNLHDIQRIQKEYKEELEKDFNNSCELSLLSNLAQEAVADWMARCPIDFN